MFVCGSVRVCVYVVRGGGGGGGGGGWGGGGAGRGVGGGGGGGGGARLHLSKFPPYLRQHIHLGVHTLDFC